MVLSPVTSEPYHEMVVIMIHYEEWDLFFWENLFWKGACGLTGTPLSPSSQPFWGNYFCLTPWSSPELPLKRAPTLFQTDKVLPPPFLMRCALPSAKPKLPMQLPKYLPAASRISLYTTPCASSPFWACLHSYFGPGSRSGMSLGILTVMTDYRRKCSGSFGGSRKALTLR